MDINIKHDIPHKRFYIGDNETPKGEVTYTIENNAMVINHTYVSPENRSFGYAKKLVEASVNYAIQEQMKIRATCSYAYKVVDENYPELLIRS